MLGVHIAMDARVRMYIRRSEVFLDIFWTSYIRSIWVLCPIYTKEAKELIFREFKYSINVLQKVLHRWHGFCSYSDFISHKYTENTGPDTKIHHLICAHSSYLYYKNCWYKNFCWYKNLFYGGPVPAFQKFLTTYLLLIRSNKTKSFLWNIKNTDRNGINEQNTHHTHRWRYFRKG